MEPEFAFVRSEIQIGTTVITRGAFLERLHREQQEGQISSGMELVCAYAGGRHYLIARCDQHSGKQLEFVVSSDWPFDLVRTLGASLVGSHARNSELRRCLAAFEPAFIEAPSSAQIPDYLSRRVCTIPYNAGEARLLLLLLFDEGVHVSHDRMRDVAIACAYHTAQFPAHVGRSDLVADLTDREIECLSWIGEGKTSDEIALIIGISRNTVNNYITSIMNKTGARTRSEAVAFAVRNQII